MTTPKIDYRATLLAQYEALRSFPLFQKMERTVEGSPWHREANVLVHTDMVVDKYVEFADDYDGHSRLINVWTHEDYLGGIACVFHDTGKPAAEVEKYSEARGKYRGYHGHEILSARDFENYAATRFPMFSGDDIFKICWMIEYHMPWNIEDAEKRRQMALTAQQIDPELEVWANALLADQQGRTSDDYETNVARSRKWVWDFRAEAKLAQPNKGGYLNQTAYFPIAPSGAGKSTFLKQLREQNADRNIRVFSLDLLRHEFYHPTDYKLAYEGAVNDKSFEARANARFHADVKAAVEDGSDLYIDNTNLSAKRRKWYLQIVKKHGFNTTAVTMPISLQEVLDRQKTRGDKVVPHAAVIQQYKSLQLPMIGEFDKIIVSEHNMKKPT